MSAAALSAVSASSGSLRGGDQLRRGFQCRPPPPTVLSHRHALLPRHPLLLLPPRCLLHHRHPLRRLLRAGSCRHRRWSWRHQIRLGIADCRRHAEGVDVPQQRGRGRRPGRRVGSSAGSPIARCRGDFCIEIVLCDGAARTDISAGCRAVPRRRGQEERAGGEGRRRGQEERAGGDGRRRGQEERAGGEGRRRGPEERAGTDLPRSAGRVTVQLKGRLRAGGRSPFRRPPAELAVPCVGLALRRTGNDGGCQPRTGVCRCLATGGCVPFPHDATHQEHSRAARATPSRRATHDGRPGQ